MRIRFASALLFAALPVSADNVYLKNGRSFEGVIAEETESQVRIRMQGGVLSLPHSHVLRVEKAESSLEQYLARKAALQRSAEAGARDWLELARWAKSQGLEQGAREAALEAARLEPHLTGLEPLMRGFGYVLDREIDRWIPYAESMRRRGFVFSNGAWISREEYAARQRQREEELAQMRAAREAAETARAARRAELALAELELQQERRRAGAQSALYGIPFYVTPGYFLPPVILLPGDWDGRPRGHRPHRGPHHDASDHGSSSFIHHPGSLIPGRLAPSH